MIIKIFTVNKNNKIELTKEELKEMLDEAYWEGFKNNLGGTTYTYTTPNWTGTPYTITTCGSNISIESKPIKTGEFVYTTADTSTPKA